MLRRRDRLWRSAAARFKGTSKGRLEAFSDGVLAIIITIMVIELRVPDGVTFDALVPLGPVFLSYLLSFALLGTSWNNHHHLLQASKVTDGRVLWANLHLLLWLSLFPFGTAWMGENAFAPMPPAVYGALQLLAGFAYNLLARALVRVPGQPPALAEAIGGDVKGIASLVLDAMATELSLASARRACDVRGGRRPVVGTRSPNGAGIRALDAGHGAGMLRFLARVRARKVHITTDPGSLRVSGRHRDRDHTPPCPLLLRNDPA